MVVVAHRWDQHFIYDNDEDDFIHHYECNDEFILLDISIIVIFVPAAAPVGSESIWIVLEVHHIWMFIEEEQKQFLKKMVLEIKQE